MKNALIILAVSLLATAFKPMTPPGYGIADIAADFKLKNVNGKMVSLADYKKVKGYIVIFTCNTCPYAIAYEDRIIALAKKYEKTYPVIAINPNDPNVSPADTYDKMQAKAKAKGLKYAYLQDEGQKVYPLFGATRTPHVYLLDANREVKYIGAIDDNAQEASEVKVKYLENAIEDLESGRDVKLAQTRAIGCGIKKAKTT